MTYEKRSINYNPDLFSSLDQNILTLIVQYISYQEGLAAFRQTSKYYNNLIESSHEGQIARKASDLENFWLSKSFYSIFNNDVKKKQVSAVTLFISVLVGFKGISDFSKGVNELNVSIYTALVSAKWISGITIPLICFYGNHKDTNNFILGSIFLTIINIMMSVACACNAIMISSARRGVFDIPGHAFFPHSYFTLLNKEGSNPSFVKGVHTAMLGMAGSATKVASITSAAAFIARLGLFANYKKIETTQKEQQCIREPLYKPSVPSK